MTQPAGFENALQRAVYDALANSPELKAYVGEKGIYDHVEPTARLPYVVIGADDIRDDSNTCFTQSRDVLVTIRVLSEAIGKTQAKDIGSIVTGLLNREIPMIDYVVVAGGFLTAVYRPSSDGQKTEGVLVFEYLIDPA